MKKIFIIHARAGEGHRMAALAVAEAFNNLDPDICVEVIDALETSDKHFRRNYAGTYYFAVKYAPALWGFFYGLFDKAWFYPVVFPFRKLFNNYHGKKILKRVLDEKPVAVINTHFFAPEFLGRAKLRGLIDAKLITVVTDFHPMSFWINPGTDHYWVLAEESRETLIKRGIHADRITVGGFPVMDKFHHHADREDLLKKYGFSSDRLTLLITSGSFGLGSQRTLLEKLAIFKDKIQCLVVCGNNRELYEALSRETYAYPTKIFGFVDFMDELMDTADLMIAKPGGSTTSESFVKRLPMAVMHPIPGQETYNVDLLKKRNVSFFVDNSDDVVAVVEQCVKQPSVLKEYCRRIDELAWPQAARKLAEQVMKLID